MGIHALRAAISGWMEAPLAWLERIPLAAARTALLWPTGPTVNVGGFLFFLALFAFNLWRGRRSRAQPAAAALDRAGMIEIEGLDVRFGDFPAVQGVSFRVAEGEAFGLVGESGSGKTTVLKAIAGLLADWRGRITVDGAALGHRRSKAFYRQVQMVFQDPYGSLHPRHTVDRTLAEPLAIHGLGDAAARVERALNAVGLDAAFRYRYPHQLSGGQRQRVAIARALMLEPKVLLLDEPTSSLDVSVQAEILNLLSELRAAGRLTYLFVSHNLAVIAHMCERLAVMNRGRIVEEAQTAALASGALADPYSRQLLKSSEGYDRQAAAALVSYD